MKSTRLILICLTLFGSLSTAGAAVRLPHVFGDGMVLQREKPVPVWGWAAPGEKVIVRFAAQQQSATAAADGAWMVRLKPLKADDKPQQLTIAGANTIVFKNVLVGDVWLCSGDFGAYWEVFAALDAANEIASADYPSMRLLKVTAKTSNAPLQDIQGSWMTCSPKTVNGFSALAYFFGRTLHRELKVPIGLIDCSYRYSYTRSWMAPEGFQLIPELKEPRVRMDSWDSTTATGQQSFDAVIAQVEKWLPQAQQALRDEKPMPPQPLLPAPLTARDDNYNSIGELSVAYFGMIRPLIPFAMRGVIWSQGENGTEANDRQHYMRGLSEGWRKAWGQGDFPFYFELLPQIGAPGTAPCSGDSWVALREGQIKSLSIPNSGMAVTFDVSDYMADTRNRQDAGFRLALWALAKEHHKDIEYSGPLYRSHRVEGDSVIVSFGHSGGLMIGEKTGLAPVREMKTGTLKHFAIAGADKQWQWAEARIVGDTVVVRSDKVLAPIAVRYAWCSNPQGANLYNRAGLPAAPFRTDDW